MADIKVYFPSTGAAEHSPAVSACWLYDEGAAKLAAVTTKIASARANKKASVHAIATQRNLAQQYVLAAQSPHEWTIADEIELQTLCYRPSSTTSSGYVYLSVRVFNADCSSVIGTLFEGEAPTNVDATDFTNRALIAGGGHVHVQNAVSMLAGHHIVIELGFNATCTVAWGGCSLYVGDDKASDLPVNETTTGNYDPWLAFTYGAAGGATNVVYMVFES